MSRTAIPLYVTNQLITAANANTYWRDNEAADWVGTAVGDSDYYTGIADKSRLAIGVAGQAKSVNAGATAPEWGGGWKLIETDLLVGAQASFDFTSIPSCYSHLKLIVNARGDTAAPVTSTYCTFNNDGGNNYGWAELRGNGAVASSSHAEPNTYIWAGSHPAAMADANYSDSIEMMIPSYKGTTFNKTCLVQTTLLNASAGTPNIRAISGWWMSTAAINRITLTPLAGNYDTGSIASLYGIG